MKHCFRLLVSIAMAYSPCFADAMWHEHEGAMVSEAYLDDNSKVSSRKKSKQVHYQSPGDQAFVADTNVMFAIIREYQKHGFVGPAAQERFKSRLVKLQQYVDQLDPEKYEVAVYRKKYLNPYKMWAKHVLKKLTPEELQRQKNIKKAKELTKEATVFFDKVSGQIDDKLGKFANMVHRMLEGLEGYTKQHSNEFYTQLSGAVKTFETQMTSVRNQMLSDYYSQVRAQGQTVDARNLTPEQRAIVSGIRSMTAVALTHARALALDLTAQARTQDFANQMVDILQKYEENDEQQDAEYNKILDQHEQNFDQDTWQDIEKNGSDMLSETYADIKKKVQKEADSSIQNFVKEKLGIDIGAIGRSVKKK